MHIAFPTILVLLTIFGFGFLGAVFNGYSRAELGGIGLVVGFFSIIALVFSPMWNPSGLPRHDIDPGTYKVGFVYMVGENVNVAVEWKAEEKVREGILHYQFNKEVFEGTLNPNSKKLVVIQNGSFKKLRLE